MDICPTSTQLVLLPELLLDIPSMHSNFSVSNPSIWPQVSEVIPQPPLSDLYSKMTGSQPAQLIQFIKHYMVFKNSVCVQHSYISLVYMNFISTNPKICIYILIILWDVQQPALHRLVFWPGLALILEPGGGTHNLLLMIVPPFTTGANVMDLTLNY